MLAFRISSFFILSFSAFCLCGHILISELLRRFCNRAHAVVVIELILALRIPQHFYCICPDIFHALSRLCNRDLFPPADEQDDFVQRDFHIVMAFFQCLLINTSIGKEFYQFHLLGKIYIAAFRVLGINRGDHDLVAEKELVFHL